MENVVCIENVACMKVVCMKVVCMKVVCMKECCAHKDYGVYEINLISQRGIAHEALPKEL